MNAQQLLRKLFPTRQELDDYIRERKDRAKRKRQTDELEAKRQAELIHMTSDPGDDDWDPNADEIWRQITEP